MRVFVTGATGFIGAVIVQELQQAGHQVLGLARSDEAAARLQAAGVEAHRGALDDLDSLQRGASAADGVIHTAFKHDFFRGPPEDFASGWQAAAAADQAAIAALGQALAGSGKPLVMTSGTLLMTPGQLALETDAPATNAVATIRLPSEQTARALAQQGVRSSIVRLSPTVHGEGDSGFVPGLIAVARQHGVSAYVGAGDNRWPAIHRLDAARLFRLALEQAPAGTALHGAAEEGVRTRDIAAAIGRQLGLPVASIAPEHAAAHFGWLAAMIGIDNPTSSELTRRLVGWTPQQPALLADIESPAYFG
ncbi:SDR family oxidoreductase [Amantichitinum ursilacus]|uniref:NAD-dependent epimerase/dehydratase domain-containing protein n=1 Tax=Amantichitinum ursilacus TaxID=857265 RepID=A0A0N0XK06_9NEIS|nr:SDR family oxidoreductase [Amantichitinum ursilacus]KPC54227.1 hypothetical protein WG78_06245 [Amantichitinum ursilacus]